MENTSSSNPLSVSQPLAPSAPSQVAMPQQAPVQSAQAPDNTADPLLTDKILPEDLDARWSNWKCLQCGFVYEGQKAVSKCPRCGNDDPDKFSDPS